MTSSLPVIRTVSLLGSGLIGGGWAALCLAHGLDVVVWDPAEDASARLHSLIERAWPSLQLLGLAEGADPSRVRFVGSAAEAVSMGDFVQESGPERLNVKRALLREVIPALREGVVLASSTSAFTVTELLSEGPRCERFVIGHPFNPPYLVPLVEVAGADFTDPTAIEAAVAFYKGLARVPVTMVREASGFIANHLQAALFREALHLVNEGIATPEQIDACLVHGLAPRWSAIGPFMVMHLGYARSGIAGYYPSFELGSEPLLAHLPPPTRNERLEAAMSEGCNRLMSGRARAAVEAQRDKTLTAVLRAQRQTTD
ncbi:3-hydroxyacyl-CoA dehydrogenase NAD-binding domain-containing protein [Bradyrhizobium sp. 131]|uniref:3-hydroxyacyl-CoA dehydrogenase NAD-binding domain-containing protein n=1 Tax=Bradyrhizobium sp. 131 TaxID=2782609 RepID=UPI001FFE30B8|nr:3-hydroxyacyl-CoA dehydrogenase NAD-binding domain-containing protein [Bradyrhizobium sp. 131]UPK20529.1 L-carnitine dehydrogenase [Bradyrhizobium sp. 131]